MGTPSTTPGAPGADPSDSAAAGVPAVPGTPVDTSAPADTAKPEDGTVPSADFKDEEGTLTPETGSKESLGSRAKNAATRVRESVSRKVGEVVDGVSKAAAEAKTSADKFKAEVKVVKEGVALVEAALEKETAINIKSEAGKKFVENTLTKTDPTKFTPELILRIQEALINRKEDKEKKDNERAKAEEAAKKAKEAKEAKKDTEPKSAPKKSDSKPFKPEKYILATTLAVHAGTSIVGSVAGGIWSGVKGAGRLAYEEVAGLGKTSLNVGIQAGKTVVYPLGRIAYGAKNRFTRTLDWAINAPTPPGGKVKHSAHPVHHDEKHADSGSHSESHGAESSSSGNKNIFSRALSGTWDLTKRAWYRTKQGTLIVLTTPVAFVGGALEGAVRAIPNDIIGIHWEGEPKVSETGAAEIKSNGKGVHVDGGVFGLGRSLYYMGKDIVWDAPVRAFTEQLTTISETPVADNHKTTDHLHGHPKGDETAEAGGGGHHHGKEEEHHAAPAADHHKTEEHHATEHHEEAAHHEKNESGHKDDHHAGVHHEESHAKHAITPVHKDKKKGGFLRAFKVVSDVWKEDEISSADFEKAVDAMDEAMGNEDGSFAGGVAKGLRGLFGPTDKIPVNYDELGKQMLKLKTKDRDAFFRSLNMVDFRKKFRVLIDNSGVRFSDALKTDEGKAEIKKQISNLFDHTGSLDSDELGTIITAIETKLGIEAPTVVAGKQGELRTAMENIRTLLGPTNPVRLRQLYLGEKNSMDINYKALGSQIFTLKDGDRAKFISSFDEAMFNSEFPLLSSSRRDLNKLLEEDMDGSIKKAAKSEFANLLKSDLKLTSTQVSSVVTILQNKIFATPPAAPAAGTASTKDRQVYDLLARIGATLNQANIDKIFAPEAAPTLNYAKFGETISKIKTKSQRDAFVKNYSKSDFEIYFRSMLTNSSFTENTKTPDGRKILKGKIASLLGYPDESEVLPDEFRDRIDALIRILNNPALKPVFPRPDVLDGLDRIREFILTTSGIDPKKLNEIYKPLKEIPTISINYSKFGEQLLQQTDSSDALGFIRGFDPADFDAEFGVLTTPDTKSKFTAMVSSPTTNKPNLQMNIKKLFNHRAVTPPTESLLKIKIGQLKSKLALASTHPKYKTPDDSDKVDYLTKFLDNQATFAAEECNNIF